MTTASERLGAQTKKVSRDIKETADIVTDSAQEKLGQVRENATEFCEQRRDNVHGVLCDFEQYVRARPVKSILIAAGIGALFGRFWMRR